MDRRSDTKHRDESRSRTEERYVAPEIQTFSPEQFLEILGPAQGYSGSGPGERGDSRGTRMFPGIR